MRRSLGSALHEQLFEPVVENDFPLVDYAVREAVDRQLTNAQIVRVEVKEIPRGLEVRIVFRLRSDIDLDVQRTVQIPKTFIGGAR